MTIRRQSLWSTHASASCLVHFTRLLRNISSIPYFSTISSLLTLFSKFFSSFLRSTCSLSVSHQYLALGEVYLPFKAAIPNNPTLQNPSYGVTFAEHGSITLYASQFHGLMRSDVLLRNYLDYNSVACATDFNFELLAVRSPLLSQSLLVSFPPLTDMLKFSG